MFGLDGLKYRSEVMVQIHAILKLMPALTELLQTFPTLKSTIKGLRQQKIPAAEAACSLSVLVIERAVAEVPDKARLLTLEQLKQNTDNEFRFFSQIAHELAEGKVSAYPEEINNLTVALGFSLWYVGSLVREGQLSQQACDIYMADVAGLLLGNSDEQRRQHRFRITRSITSSGPTPFRPARD
jgi:hypothetical protein